MTVGNTKEFHIQPAINATDHVIASLKKGGLKIEVFRHKQVSPTGLSSLRLSVPSLSTLIDVLPKILFFIMCFAFVVQRSSLCVTEDTSSRMNKLTYGVCWASFSLPLTPLAAILFVVTVGKQVSAKINKRASAQKKSQ